MNRRNFFKVFTGFVAGIYAAFVPKAIGSKRSGTRLATKKEIREFTGYLREHYYYWGSDSNNIESYFHIIDEKYTMIPKSMNMIAIYI